MYDSRPRFDSPYLVLRLRGCFPPVAGDTSPAPGAASGTTTDAASSALAPPEPVFRSKSPDLCVLPWRSSLQLPADWRAAHPALAVFTPLPHVLATDVAPDGASIPSGLFDVGHAFLARCMADTQEYRAQLWLNDPDSANDLARSPHASVYTGTLSGPFGAASDLYPHYLGHTQANLAFSDLVNALASNTFASERSRDRLWFGMGAQNMHRSPYVADFSAHYVNDSMIGSAVTTYEPIPGCGSLRSWVRWAMRVSGAPGATASEVQSLVFDLPYFIPSVPSHSDAALVAFGGFIAGRTPQALERALADDVVSLANFAFSDVMLHPHWLGQNRLSVSKRTALPDARAPRDDAAAPRPRAVYRTEVGLHCVLAAPTYERWQALSAQLAEQTARDQLRRDARTRARHDGDTPLAPEQGGTDARYGRGRGRPPGVPNRITPEIIVRRLASTFPIMRDTPTRWLAEYPSTTPIPWGAYYSDGRAVWHDPTRGWTTFTPLMPVATSMPLPLSAVNYMHPDVLLWRACLARLARTPETARAAWHATYPTIVRAAQVGDVTVGDVLIPLPVDVVYSTLAAGVPHGLLASLMPVPPAPGQPLFTLPTPHSAEGRYAHATYAAPREAFTPYDDTPVVLPDLRR